MVLHLFVSSVVVVVGVFTVTDPLTGLVQSGPRDPPVVGETS